MAKRNLHDLPKFEDRWSHVYLERGRVDQDASSLLFTDKEGETRIPIDQLALVMLGPGTRVTHSAIKVLSDNNCLVAWTGEQGVRLYAHGTGGTHQSRRLLHQAKTWADETERMRVVCRMFEKRFPDPVDRFLPIEALRAMEGVRVRRAYEKLSAQYEVEWTGRAYDQREWRHADPLNRALSSANACLYGICHAAILSGGYSPAIGFVHTGKMLSFVYDVSDLYKIELTVPAAFQVVSESTQDVERRVRIRCRDMFHESRLIKRILPDIAEVLDVGDDTRESADELEGRAVTLADRTAQRRILGES